MQMNTVALTDTRCWRMEVDEVALEGEGILGLIRTGGRLNRVLRRDEQRDRSTLASWVVPTKRITRGTFEEACAS